MICGTVPSFASNVRGLLTASFAIRWQRAQSHHASPSACRLRVLTTPLQTIYPSSLRSDSEYEECIWILQS
jgi:hypothetical protein